MATMDFDAGEARDVAEELLDKLAECAELIERLIHIDREGAARLKAYALADFQGNEYGWMGRNFTIDLVQEYLEEIDDRANKTGDWAEDEEECAD